MANCSAPRAGAGRSPARYGFSDVARAEAQLRASGWWTDGGPAPEFEPVVAALSRAPDPDLALHSVDRLREATGSWD